MDKEKEIQEMAQVMCCAGFDKVVCSDCHIGIDVCDPIYYATALYAAGYRKADEVIKSLLNELCDTVIWYDECDEPVYARDCVWYIELCKKYAVEVKE